MGQYADNINKIKWANKENKEVIRRLEKNKSTRLKLPNKTTQNKYKYVIR